MGIQGWGIARILAVEYRALNDPPFWGGRLLDAKDLVDPREDRAQFISRDRAVPVILPRPCALLTSYCLVGACEKMAGISKLICGIKQTLSRSLVAHPSIPALVWKRQTANQDQQEPRDAVLSRHWQHTK